MEHIREQTSSFGFVGDMLEIGGGEISEKDVCTAGGFMNFFRYISNRKIYRIGTLVTEDSNLSLVGRDDEWNNSSSW